MLLILFSMIQIASLLILEDVPYVVKNEVFSKRKVYQRWENCIISSVSVFLSSKTGHILHFLSKVVILSHFWRENVNSGQFFFKTPQILKPGVGPAIDIFLQVKIIFEDSIILMFTLWFWDQRSLSNVMISPVSHISVKIVPETVSAFLAVRIGVFSPFFQITKVSRGHVCLTCWFPPQLL